MNTDEYARAIFGPRDPILDQVLRRSLGTDGMPTIQVDDGAGRVLQLLTMLARPQRALEIGTLFGYSAIYIARGLPPGATLVSLETDADSAEVARRNIAAAGVAHAVDVITIDALEYLQRDGLEGFDLVFIDGEKRAYPEYLKACYPLLHEGGVLIADDAFAVGDFTPEPADVSESTAAINTYNRAVARAPHLLSAFVGTSAGLMVSVKGIAG